MGAGAGVGGALRLAPGLEVGRALLHLQELVSISADITARNSAIIGPSEMIQIFLNPAQLHLLRRHARVRLLLSLLLRLLLLLLLLLLLRLLCLLSLLLGLLLLLPDHGLLLLLLLLHLLHHLGRHEPLQESRGQF